LKPHVMVDLFYLLGHEIREVGWMDGIDDRIDTDAVKRCQLSIDNVYYWYRHKVVQHWQLRKKGGSVP